MKEQSNQESIFLEDFSETGKERPWAVKKARSVLISKSFLRNSCYSANAAKVAAQNGYSYNCYDSDLFKISNLMRYCGSYLEFTEYRDGKRRLTAANFCKARLCPMCAWRRSVKIYNQITRILDVCHKPTSRYIMVTLTVRNVNGGDLNRTLDKFFKAYNNFHRLRRVKQIIIGGLRALEVTRNSDLSSDYYGTYHPHIHALYMVPDNYLPSSDMWIGKDEWRQLWRRAMVSAGFDLRRDELPVVNCEMVHYKGSVKQEDRSAALKKAVAEVAKYPVKDADIISPLGDDFTDDTVNTLHYALKQRRLVAFEGLFKSVKRQLQLDDAEDGDLLHVEALEDLSDEDIVRVLRYAWSSTFRQYVLCNFDKEVAA